MSKLILGFVLFFSNGPDQGGPKDPGAGQGPPPLGGQGMTVGGA